MMEFIVGLLLGALMTNVMWVMVLVCEPRLGPLSKWRNR
jgi:hypothetical protein